MKTWDTVAILGVGLIGASIGLALRKRKLAKKIIGIARRQSTLTTAKRRGAVTHTTTDIAAGVVDADLVVVCTPVELIAEHVRAVALNCRKNARITDAGSAKEEIVVALDHAFALHNPRGAAFVGSHPMAGSEKNGPQNADAELFEGCVTVVTSSPQTNAKALRDVKLFWRSLGANVVQLGPKEHDQAVAAISHLPHLVASVLAASVPQSALPLAAGGWRDTTRVASGDPHLWRQILSQNRFHVLHALDKFCHELTDFRRALAYNDRDKIEQLLTQGKQVRESTGKRNRREERT
jgi:prephenate dehydrogenase